MLESPARFVTPVQPFRSCSQSMPITALRPILSGALTPALALLLGLVSPGAQALGLGRPVVHSALGKPLDVSFPLLLAEGEQLSDSCIRAEVLAGDARVPAGLLQMRVEGEPGQRRVRLQSQARIDEPALRITLALGCPLMLTREFNAFVDPGTGSASAPAVAPAPAPVYVPPPAVDTPSAPATVAAAPAPAAKPKPKASPKPRVSGPRLTLERPEILAEAPRPGAPAASAPEMELTPELEAQISQLEQTVAQLRAELLARQEGAAAEAASAPASAADPAEAASAPAVIASAPAAVTPALPATRHSPYRDPLTWLLTLALSLIAGSAAYYFSRWRDQRARQELAYWRALHAAEGAAPPVPAPAPSPGIAPPVFSNAAPLPDEGQHQITRPQPRPMPWPPAESALGPEFANAMQATQPLPPRAVPEPIPAPVAPVITVADDLLDLQQQVEFLVLLGQHDAAADLLATRLRQPPVVPMPYLMLMELCQQRGDTEVFAELGRQFEQRFRTLAPSWEQSLSRGRSLDACPSVIAHLQMVWTDPEAAMTMLQTLVAEGKGPGVASFELPASRDLLTLYSVARDLFEAGMRSDEVDLMLPLDSSFGR